MGPQKHNLLNFRDNPLYQATKGHLNNSWKVKKGEKLDGKLNQLICFCCFYVQCLEEEKQWTPPWSGPTFSDQVSSVEVMFLCFAIDWLIDWLMIAYIALFSAILSRLTALACGSTWVTSYIAHFVVVVEYPPKWCTYSAGTAGATWNCSRLGASPVYTIQPYTMSLHAKPHTHMYACLAVTCHLHFWQNDRDLLRAAAVTRGWNGHRYCYTDNQ